MIENFGSISVLEHHHFKRSQMKEVVLIDGGIGQEIYRRAGKPAHPLWSTKVMMDQPEIVKEVHKDFIKAGSCIITINSYTCTPARLERDGEKSWFEKLQKSAITIALEARKELGSSAEKVQIAGCLPPLTGSYTTDSRSFSQLKSEYQQIVDVQAPHVDILLIETISNIKEATAATEAAMESGKPTLLSFTLSDKNPSELRSGESIEEALSATSTYDLKGVLFNCSFPETISTALKSLKPFAKPIGGYANGFTAVEPLKPGGTVDSLAIRKDLDAKTYASHVMNWIKNGATIIGGCCEVSPSYISYLHQELKANGYQAVSFE